MEVLKLKDNYNKIYSSEEFENLIKLKTTTNESKSMFGEDYKYFLISFYIYGYYDELFSNKLDFSENTNAKESDIESEESLR
jgi:hypothetical protein